MSELDKLKEKKKMLDEKINFLEKKREILLIKIRDKEREERRIKFRENMKDNDSTCFYSEDCFSLWNITCLGKKECPNYKEKVVTHE